MSRLGGQGRLVIALSTALAFSGTFAGAALAGDHHDRCGKYDIVQGYILQPSGTVSMAQAQVVGQVAQAPTAPQASPAASASPQALGAPAAAPQFQAAPPQLPAAPTQPLLQAAPVNYQVVAAPAQTVQVALAPVSTPVQAVTLAAAPTPVQAAPVALAAAPTQVQYVAVQAAPAPTVSLAPVQVVTQSALVATPVQLLLPHRKCGLFCHHYGR
jgi:hypothetical protein